ncbi:hypothetical protein [Flavobacterium ajazii]|uniref:hypothetical protein n=1 Tax=Flavobacterium ajazii TaxID=2692318 RepID=UPI0013D469BF|nr:hypothetical protein [Flavobacterium ajazii]
MKKIFLTLSLMTAMFFVSCDQNSADDGVQGGTSANRSAVNSQANLASNALVADCENPVSDSAVVTKALTGSSGDYCVWNTTTKTIGSTTVQFEGMYASGIRPAEEGWYVGVVDTSYVCTSGWSTIAAAINVKNATGNVGTSPNCTSVIVPQNVVSAQGTIGSLNFGLGYYTYASQAFSITKKIVIWKDDFETDPTAYSDPTKTNGDITEAYLIEVTSIVPTFGTPPFYGTVSYTYTKVL